MFIHVHVCACICVGMYMCIGIPLHPHIPPCSLLPHPTTPVHQGFPSNQAKVNKNWMNWDISILFEDFRSLHPCALIQVTFGVQVGGCPITNSIFYFWAKNVHIFCTCEPPIKNFPVFTLESDIPCLDWQLICCLTSDPFTTLSNYSRNEDKSAKIDLDINFITEPSTIEKFVMHPLIFQCVLYKWSMTLNLYHQPSMV